MDLKKLISWYKPDKVVVEAESKITKDSLTNQEIAQSALVQNELMNQLTSLHNAALVSETDLLGNIIFANDTFCELAKYSREELMGQNHRILKSGQQPQEIFENLWRTISKGQVWRGEVLNKAKDGSFYWVFATITPALDGDGKPYKYISVRFDITQQKLHEQEIMQANEEMAAQDEELRQNLEELEAINEELYKTQLELKGRQNALDNAALCSETNLAGDIIYANDTFCRVAKYTREELMGQNHRILKSGKQPDEIFVEMWKTISSGKYFQGEVLNKAKDGTFYWVLATITPVLGADGKPYKYISVRFEITQQKQLQAQLQQHIEEIDAQLEEIAAQEEELRQNMEEMTAMNEDLNSAKLELTGQISALNNAAIVSQTNLTGDITYINDTFCSISKYTREELMGQNHRILKSGHQPDEIFEELWKTISTGKVWKGVIKNRAKDGSYYWVDSTITPVLDQYGKPAKYIGVRFDISSEKQKEDQLEYAKELLEKKVKDKEGELADSVTYSQRIQRAIITPVQQLNNLIPSQFEAAVFFKPKDKVGGDFYWAGQWKNKTVLAMGDGTGHGVPGAFLSIVGISSLSKLVEDRGLTEPSSILDELDVEVKRMLNQENEEALKTQDSIEMSVVSFQADKNRVFFASAMRPAIFYKNGEQVILQPDKRPIGGTLYESTPFNTQYIDFEPGDTLYLFSDGFLSQIGGQTNQHKKLGQAAFREIIAKVYELERLNDQITALTKILEDWRGFFEDQTDDVIVIAIRMKK